MTIKEHLLSYLTEKGLFPEEASKVVESVIADSCNEAMASRWNDQIEGYPPYLMAVLSLSADDHAVKWIEANKPRHWAKRMFEG